MVRLNCLLTRLPWPSVTCMVKVNVPAVAGVPERSSPVWLSVMSELSVRPGGGAGHNQLPHPDSQWPLAKCGLTSH
jgi:hypothetical protein